MTIVVFIAAAICAGLLTKLAIGYALDRQVLDLPNDRSSHTVPTPRGGGIAIVATFGFGLTALWYAGVASTALALATLVGGGIVAVAGFIDDHRPMPARYRLSMHMAAIVVAIWILGAPQVVDFGAGPVALGALGFACTVFYMVWFLNLFNFMDGTDGIASMQALFMCLAGAAMIAMAEQGVDAGATPLLLLAGATTGFLFWNWPPAKVFMGDVGSGFLGAVLGLLAVETIVHGPLTIWAWLVLGSAFVADTTVTLARRALRREPLAEAHRSHAYQRLSRSFGGHRSVMFLYGAVDIVWVLPWACFVALHPTYGFVATLACWIPLFAAAWLLGAGQPGELAPFRDAEP